MNKKSGLTAYHRLQAHSFLLEREKEHKSHSETLSCTWRSTADTLLLQLAAEARVAAHSGPGICACLLPCLLTFRLATAGNSSGASGCLSGTAELASLTGLGRMFPGFAGFSRSVTLRTNRRSQIVKLARIRNKVKLQQQYSKVCVDQ